MKDTKIIFEKPQKVTKTLLCHSSQSSVLQMLSGHKFTSISTHICIPICVCLSYGIYTTAIPTLSSMMTQRSHPFAR